MDTSKRLVCHRDPFEVYIFLQPHGVFAWHNPLYHMLPRSTAKIKPQPGTGVASKVEENLLLESRSIPHSDIPWVHCFPMSVCLCVHGVYTVCVPCVRYGRQRVLPC